MYAVPVAAVNAVEAVPAARSAVRAAALSVVAGLVVYLSAGQCRAVWIWATAVWAEHIAEMASAPADTVLPAVVAGCTVAHANSIAAAWRPDAWMPIVVEIEHTV